MIIINLDWLNRVMRKHGLTRAAHLAEFAGISAPTAGNYIAGKPLEKIEVKALTALATAFGVKNPLTILEYVADE